MSKVKCFNYRMNAEIWRFLKKEAMDTEKSMTEIITNCIKAHQKKVEKKLEKSIDSL